MPMFTDGRIRFARGGPIHSPARTRSASADAGAHLVHAGHDVLAVDLHRIAHGLARRAVCSTARPSLRLTCSPANIASRFTSTPAARAMPSSSARPFRS